MRIVLMIVTLAASGPVSAQIRWAQPPTYAQTRVSSDQGLRTVTYGRGLIEIQRASGKEPAFYLPEFLYDDVTGLACLFSSRQVHDRRQSVYRAEWFYFTDTGWFEFMPGLQRLFAIKWTAVVPTRAQLEAAILNAVAATYGFPAEKSPSLEAEVAEVPIHEAGIFPEFLRDRRANAPIVNVTGVARDVRGWIIVLENDHGDRVSVRVSSDRRAASEGKTIRRMPRK